MKKNLFLNKKFLIKWTENESAFLIQSPFNANAGIWWAKKWYQQSKFYDGYFATGIVLDKEYQEITYDEKGIKVIIIISGQKLFEQFNYMKNMNQIKYLKMAKEKHKCSLIL